MYLPGFWRTAVKLALLNGAFLLQSCGLMGGFLHISGQLTLSNQGCYVVPDNGKDYEVIFGRYPLPPMGAEVTLLVREVNDASSCMVGPLVEVVRVEKVRTDP